MTIDQNTGLPQLPEGYFWRVEEHTITIFADAVWGEWRENVRGWYQGSKTAELRVRKERRRGFLFGSVKVNEVRIKHTQRMHLKTYGEWEFSEGKMRNTEADPVTPGNVVERCQEVLLEWEADKSRKAIYGDYPPKKLES